MTLTDFLLARIAEDEAVARAASKEAGGETWHARNYDYDGIAVSPGVDDRPETHEIGPIPGRVPPMAVTDWRDAVTDQITRWSPARVLAECEARRRIVEGYLEDGMQNAWGGCGDDCEWKAIEWALQVLALPYADHPDYREEWRP